jgi:hypothetical protein
MQVELDGMGLSSNVRILGVNHVDAEMGQADMYANKVLPLLQDVAATNAFALWQVTIRDVVILDEGNQVVAVFNLSLKPLDDQDNYDELKALIASYAND